jgi:hypothetical protein
MMPWRVPQRRPCRSSLVGHDAGVPRWSRGGHPARLCAYGVRTTDEDTPGW